LEKTTVPPTPIPNPSPSPSLPPALPGQHLAQHISHALTWLRERPWLAVAAFVVLLSVYCGRLLVWRWRQRRLASHARYVCITPPPEVDPAGASAWWANLYELLNPRPLRRLLCGVPHVAVEYRWVGRQLTIGVWFPGTVPATPVVAAARAAWPGTAATITDPPTPVPADALPVGGGLRPALPAWYPLEVEHEADPMRALVAAAANLGSSQRACVQVLTRPATPRQVARLRRGASALRTGRPARSPLDLSTWLNGALNLLTELIGPSRAGSHPDRQRSLPPDPVRDRDARGAVDKTLATQWEVAIRYAVAHTNPNQRPVANLRANLVTQAHAIASSFGAYTGRNRLRRTRLPQPAAVLAGRAMRSGFVLSDPELAVIAGLPQDLAVPGLDRARAKAVPRRRQRSGRGVVARAWALGGDLVRLADQQIRRGAVEHRTDHVQIVQPDRGRGAGPQRRHLARADLQPRVGQPAAHLGGLPDPGLRGSHPQVPLHRLTPSTGPAGPWCARWTPATPAPHARHRLSWLSKATSDRVAPGSP
jgi:hypothetical protein